ncbi:protein sidekick-2-like [Sinocyclocheilus grahami]|uniref:protein sidekick-2-like n=1 Tax=Sinocyclocheilus grahami TaxID=75366 RepID=UPI0007ACC00B|nr:PREDICTED: protein sidekick-2-like [Sinocyclocheilus grahami]
MQRSSQVQVAYMEGFVEGERSQVVSQGEAALISPPQIHSFPRPGITWFRDGRKIPPSSRIALTLDNTLVILSAVAPDAGRYYAQAVNDKNGENKTSQPIILNVEKHPQFVKEPDRHITAEMEKVVDIPCQARGVPQPDIVWYKDAVPISPAKTPRYRVLVGGSLQINGLLPDDTGMFQCFARNLAGEIQTNTYLAVTSIAPNITAGPSDSAVIDGMSIILHCETSGAPRPAITWQKADRVLASGSVQLPRFTLLESGSLLISPAHLSDVGSYTCMASNSRGIDEASADLVVWARTRITNPPQDQSVIKGTKAAMTCGVTHDPSVTVRHIWEKGGAAIDVKSSPRLRLDSNGTLHLSQTWSGDIGTYTCKVTSVGGNDSRNAHLRVRQLPHAPENLIATLSSSERRTINLTWAQAFDGNSPLIRYILEVSENNAPWTVLLANIDPEASSVIVGGLIPARSYQFRLCAVNDVGKGQFSRETVRFYARLIWQPPAQPNGIILAYQIAFRKNSSSITSANVDVLNPSARQYTATGLKPESVYVFRLTAQTRKGWGEAAEALVVTTEKRARPQPTSHPVVPQEEVQARSVLLSWEPGSDGLSPIRYYTVQYRELPDSNWTVHSASVNHEASSYVIDKLKPFTSYQFRVKATNDIGDSEYSEESEAITTLQDAPDKAPTILSVTPHTTTSVLVRWKPPPEEEINGILLGFRVRYRELRYDRLRSFTVRTVNSPSANWAELTAPYSMRNLTESSLTQYELDNLNKHKRYEIRLSVYNAVGEGPTSSPQEVFVGEAVPTAPPQNAAIQSSTATQLDVTWDPPPVEAQNGDIQGYKATPSAPSFIHFSELTTTSVNMSWGEPKQRNGIVEGYRVVYEPCTPVDDSSPHNSGVSKVVTVDVKGSTPLWMKIKDLADGVTYNFRIRAKTLTYGPEIEANITTGPGEGAPGPPGEPFISRYGSALTLHWSSGDPGRAPITRYVIEARPSDEGLWDILIKDIPKEVTSYTLNLDTLREGVTYDFRVIAVNDYGYGSPSAPSPSISAQKVSPFYEEWWFLVVIALVGLIFILLLIFILIIRGQSRKYTEKTDSGAHSNCTSLPLSHGEMVRLDEGRFPALELNNRRLSVKNSFYRKNGIYTRSPPRPSPGSLHYSDEDVSIKYNDLVPAESSSLTEKPSEVSDSQVIHPNKVNDFLKIVFLMLSEIKIGPVSPPRPSPGSLHYSDEDVSIKYNDLVPAESSSLTEKPSEVSDSQVIHPNKCSDSEYELDPSRQKTHSFVNHYISDPTYYNSWRRQQKGVSRPPAYGYAQPDTVAEQESRPHPPPLPPLPPLLPHSNPSPQPQGQGTLFRPKGSRTPTPSLLTSDNHSQHTLYRPPSSLGTSAQVPATGFSSFV